MLLNSKILPEAHSLICLPKYYAENKMNLFGLSFLSFILKWSAGKGTYPSEYLNNWEKFSETS